MKVLDNLIVFVISCILVNTVSAASSKTYGERICNNSGYKCYKVKISDSWSSLFPSASKREIIMKLNRVDTPLTSKMTIAIPDNCKQPVICI